MKTNTLALSLTLAASLLVACGGGGDARSPDRPGAGLDPDSLRVDFPLGNQLAGTGTNFIPVRMLATQTDGVEINLGPELNVTADTQWSLGGSVGSPAIAELADEIRDAGELRDVQDILSTVRLASTDTLKNLTITGLYNFQGTAYSVTEPFTIVPPIVSGPKYISGQDVIALNPSDPTDTETVNYQLLQNLQGLPGVTENSTVNATFCADNSHFVFGETQTPSTGAVAPATITNPFTSSDQNQIAVTVFAIENGESCTDDTVDKIASLIVTLVPATVSEMAICAVANPAADACDTSDQVFFNTDYLDQCKGLTEDSIDVPAAQRLQMVAKLTYTNPSNPNQAPFDKYQCSGPGILTWSADPTTIFAEGPDETTGDASLISQADYEAIADQDPASTVTGIYEDDSNAAIQDTLELKLVDAEVTAISIVRADGTTPAEDTIYLNVFNDGIDYVAMCTFVDFDSSDTIACPAANVSWTIDQGTLVTVDPANNSNSTTVDPISGATVDVPVVATLTATYEDGISDVSDNRTINVVADEVVELHLYQVSNANSPDDIYIDEFSCVGRTDLVGDLADGETYIRGNQQFYAYAVFESGIDDVTDAYLANPKLNSDSPLKDVTDHERTIFSAVSGYWSGNASDSPSCVSSAIEIPGADQIPGADEIPGLPEISSEPAASFGQTKGSLESRGLLRLSTVCVQAFIDSDDDGFTEGDITTEEGSTVLVLPAADDDLLTYTNELCEILEPVLTLGGNFPGLEGPGLVLPLVYTVSTIVDPILSTLATNDDGGYIPVEGLVDALITGNFSSINENLPDSPVGLGTITSGLIEGVDAVPGLGIIVDTLDACLLAPVTSTVGTLLNGILGLNPEAFGDLANISFDDCQGIFGNLAP
ncbi:Uncharacterised protein [Zhongshania aliphaticivorans]|uniref:Uncharacterized protein n=1 Tax=Zhongshania aliphaticivorans TaxID=1470434 RepID=A0A5S9MSC2_9GAMM|nr:hypothetical protein [Zhongshania aliphaticivorans]CAA0078353.1 Uncharacterised protein [Zhongshania aliphaticivorans]CAA0086717.1 Uncharacterised protein [Zhongshania aliphaticivorans]